MCILKTLLCKKKMYETNENQECPICFENLTDTKNITLSCRHTFCISCLQKVMKDFIKFNKTCYCPLCRKDICKKDISNIFKEWYLYKCIPEHWIQSNIVLYKKIYVKSLKQINYNNNIKVLLPLYKHNNINQQLFFYSEKIFSLQQCPSVSENLENYFSVFYIGNFNYNIKWKNFLKKNFLKFTKCTNNDIYRNYQNSTTKIRFYIKNMDNIITINRLNQTIEKGFKFYNQPCCILFDTYILYVENKYYLINEIHKIMYI
uniref:RING-type domain-containing protein n=1 Tax=viral metagenome TaxID=1070528 RepID=A0A6C0J8A0_9ZZZZ